MLGPHREATLGHLHAAFAASESDLLLIAANLVASWDLEQGLCLANHVLQEVEVRQRIRELNETDPGPRHQQPRRQQPPSCSDDSFSYRDQAILREIRAKLTEIQQSGTRVTQGLAGMALLKVEFLLEKRAW